MDVNEAIYRRRASRSFTAEAVPPEVVQELLDTAVQAPSALNLQPWAFAVFQGRPRLRSFSERAKAHLVATLHPYFELHLRSELYTNPDFDLFYGASTLVVIYAAPGRLHPVEDCCLAAQNLMLAAHGRGLATCPIGFARPWFELGEIKRELGISSTYTAVFPVVVGYAAGPSPAVPRNPPEILCWERAAATHAAMPAP